MFWVFSEEHPVRVSLRVKFGLKLKRVPRPEDSVQVVGYLAQWRDFFLSLPAVLPRRKVQLRIQPGATRT